MTQTFEILNGRTYFYQWDSNQKLKVSDPTCTEVHYENGTTEEALPVEVRNGVADVPNIFLQSSNAIRVYGFVIDSDGRYTKIEKVFRVSPRKRPASYVYTETETLNYSSLAERIAELEENGGGGAGVSPTVEIIPIEGGKRITITDIEGEHIFDVMDGADGRDGRDGQNGRDGQDGADGKSAYQYAVDAGYTGTEVDFAALLVNSGYTLPVADVDTLGGVKPATKTEDMTQAVGVDVDGKLFTTPSSGSDENESNDDISFVQPSHIINCHCSNAGVKFAIEPNRLYFVEHGKNRNIAGNFYDSNGNLLFTAKTNGWNSIKNDNVIFERFYLGMSYNNNIYARIKVLNEQVSYCLITSVKDSTVFVDQVDDLYSDDEKIKALLENKDLMQRILAENSCLKQFKGIYKKENGGVPYLFDAYGAMPSKYGENINVYYSGDIGDWWIYPYRTPQRFDKNVAKYGDIIYFDGTYLIALDNSCFNEGVSTETHYDVCIIGGGSGGIGAAYALKDSGLKVCLVEKLNALGGTNLHGGVIRQIASPVGDWYKTVCHDAYWNNAIHLGETTQTAGSEELFNTQWADSMRNTGTANVSLGKLMSVDPWWMARKYMDDLSENITILCCKEVVGSTVKSGKITSATIRDTRTGVEETIIADYFIDSTGDNYLLRNWLTLDVDYYIGSDDATKYNEPAIKSGFSADHYDINTLEPAYLILYKTGHSYANGNESRYTEDRTAFPTVSDVTAGLNARHKISLSVEGTNAYNTSYLPSIAESVMPDFHARITSQDFIDGGYDFAYEKGKINSRAHYIIRNPTANEFYGGVFPLLGIREGYRMKCDYMLTQQDIETEITSENIAEKHIIALSSWYADIHSATTSTYMSVDTNAITPTWMNGVPYETLIPTAYTNALVASRGLGASHIGASAFRLTRTMLSVGYAAGKAAKLAAEGNLTDMRNVNIADLQEEVGIMELITTIEALDVS